MATDRELADQILAGASAGTEDEGIFESIKNDTIKSFRAAGMMLGLYKPESEEETKSLRTRFAADAAMLAVSTVTGGAAGVALKGIKPVARAILGGALTGGAGTATFAAVEGEDPLLAGAAGAALGAGFGAAAHGIGGVVRGAASRVASMKSDASLQARNQLVARTAGEIFGAAPGPLDTARLQLRELGELPVEERIRALGGTPNIDRVAPTSQLQVALEQGINPADLPSRGPTSQRILDPFSLAKDMEDQLADMRAHAVAPGEGLIGQLARGTAELPPGQRLTIEPGAIRYGPARPRDARGRFARANIVKGIVASTPDAGTKGEVHKEASDIARKAFIEFVGGDKPKGLLPPGSTRARQPRSVPTRRPRRSRVTPRSVEASVAEFLADGAPEEISTLALANSVGRRLLMKASTKVESTIKDKLGREIDLSSPTDNIYRNVSAIFRNTLIPVESALKKMGASGNELGTRMSVALDRAMRRAAEDIEAIRELRRFTKAERRHIAHVLNGDDVPKDERIAAMAKLIREHLDGVADEAGAVQLRVLQPRTGEVAPFAPRRNYYPLEYSEKTIRRYLSPGPEREEALKRIMQTEQGISRKEAEALLRRYLAPHASEFRYGHLQIARDMVLPGWEEDPLDVLPQYFLRGWKRIETAREFGAQDQLTKRLVRNMAREGYDYEYAAKAFRAFADKEPVALSELAGLTRTINMVSLLSTTGIVQLAQHSNIIALTGWKNYLQGLAVALGTLRKNGQDPAKWAARTGSYMQELLHDVVPFGSRGVGSWWAKFIGLEPLDKANRIVAAFAGAIHADDLAAKYVAETNPQRLATIARQLQKMRLDPAEIKAAGGVLTPEQRLLAGQQLSLTTQFRGSVLDMPIAKHSAAGQFIYLFKNFAVQQTRFVSHLMGEARRGNYAPLTRYMAATGTLTAATGATIHQVKYGVLSSPDKKPEREAALAYLEFMLQAGALGIASDGLRGMASGPEMFRAFLAGPSVNDAIGFFGRDLPELARGNPRQMMHDTLKHWPLFGRRLADYLVPLDE